jgi:hypothetical protein
MPPSILLVLARVNTLLHHCRRYTKLSGDRPLHHLLPTPQDLNEVRATPVLIPHRTSSPETSGSSPQSNFFPSPVHSAARLFIGKFTATSEPLAPFFCSNMPLCVAHPPDLPLVDFHDQRSTTPRRRLPCLPPHRRQPPPRYLRPYFFDLESQRDSESSQGSKTYTWLSFLIGIHRDTAVLPLPRLHEDYPRRKPCLAVAPHPTDSLGEDLIPREATGEQHRSASFPRWADALGRILDPVLCSHFSIFVFIFKFTENRVNF